MGTSLSGLLGGVDLVTHGLNSLYVLFDLFLGATPVRLLHFYHSTLVGLIYVIFSAIYTTQTDIAIYPILDWNEAPGEAAMYGLLGALIGAPAVWVLVYGLYRLRMFLFTCTGAQGDVTTSQDELYRDQVV